MQLVEQHIINRNDPRYAIIDAAAFASKNLYKAVDQVRIVPRNGFYVVEVVYEKFEPSLNNKGKGQ